MVLLNLGRKGFMHFKSKIRNRKRSRKQKWLPSWNVSLLSKAWSIKIKDGEIL